MTSTEKPATQMLRATVEQKRAYAEKKRNGKLAQHIDLAPYIQELKAAREFREALPDPTPTPHRLAKGDLSNEWRTTPNGMKIGRQWRNVGIVEQRKSDWPDHIYAAFVKIVSDFETAAKARAPQIGNYTGIGGGTPGPRLGGARTQVGSQAMNRIETIERELAPELWETLLLLVLEIIQERMGRKMTMQEIGHYIWPAIRGKRDCEMIALSHLKAAGAQLAKEYHELEKDERWKAKVEKARMREVG